MHPGEHRIVLGAESVHEQDVGAQFLLISGLGFRTARWPHQPDIRPVVDEFKIGVGGHGRDLDRDPVLAAEAEGLGKFHRQLEPEWRHRVTGAEVVAGQRRVPGHVQSAGHW